MFSRKNTFIFPSLPRGQKLVDKDGFPTPVFSNFFDFLTSSLQEYFNVEGFKIPKLPNTDFAILTSDQSNNRFLVNETDNTLRFNINGVWKTVPLT